MQTAAGPFLDLLFKYNCMRPFLQHLPEPTICPLPMFSPIPPFGSTMGSPNGDTPFRHEHLGVLVKNGKELDRISGVIPQKEFRRRFAGFL